jgi:hypothetical protein
MFVILTDAGMWIDMVDVIYISYFPQNLWYIWGQILNIGKSGEDERKEIMQTGFGCVGRKTGDLLIRYKDGSTWMHKQYAYMNRVCRHGAVEQAE